MVVLPLVVPAGAEQPVAFTIIASRIAALASRRHQGEQAKNQGLSHVYGSYGSDAGPAACSHRAGPAPSLSSCVSIHANPRHPVQLNLSQNRQGAQNARRILTISPAAPIAPGMPIALSGQAETWPNPTSGQMDSKTKPRWPKLARFCSTTPIRCHLMIANRCRPAAGSWPIMCFVHGRSPPSIDPPWTDSRSDRPTPGRFPFHFG